MLSRQERNHYRMYMIVKSKEGGLIDVKLFLQIYTICSIEMTVRTVRARLIKSLCLIKTLVS